jgi:hypothetical protein
MDTIVNAAIAQLPATIGPASNSANFALAKEEDVPADSPRTTPIPAPLAIPPSRLFRAHGMSVTFLALLTG